MDGLVGTSGVRPRARGRDVAKELAEREQFDAAALAIAERVRSTLSVEAVMQLTADDLGYVTGASRCLIQLEPNADGVCRMLEWDRGDTKPVGVEPPTPIAKLVFDRAEPLVVDDVASLDGDAVAGYLRSVGSRSVIAFPVRWHEARVVGVVSFQDSKPRDWRTSVLPLLQRLEGQLAAAFVQAELFARQSAMLAELESIARMREDLIANVSHELRTPLTAITGAIKTLRRDDVALDDGRRRELLAMLDQQADRLVDLATDLLDFSRYRHGRQRLSLVRIPLSDLLARALREVDIPDERHIHLDVHDCDVEVDPNRMIQVLTNLLVNAVRHGSGDIFVVCRSAGPEVTLRVSDEGAGIAAGREDELFEPFAHDSDRGDSTGLGLSISRSIVDAHGGSLVYYAAEGGERHQFEVKLPAPSGNR